MRCSLVCRDARLIFWPFYTGVLSWVRRRSPKTVCARAPREIDNYVGVWVLDPNARTGNVWMKPKGYVGWSMTNYSLIRMASCNFGILQTRYTSWYYSGCLCMGFKLYFTSWWILSTSASAPSTPRKTSEYYYSEYGDVHAKAQNVTDDGTAGANVFQLWSAHVFHAEHIDSHCSILCVKYTPRTQTSWSCSVNRIKR